MVLSKIKRKESDKMKTKINRITAQGFKSFNKKISVPLSDNFNIFCGPNGVGKSNIVDAVCFVLGRTSAKSLRAGRLHELIFHGGDGKKPADRASVTMYLDNKNRAFKEFDDDEVSITRKVNKKGVSVYKLNGRTTTREKILQALSPTRIYPDGHNIVLQGDITQIIEMNAVERRGLIDEISGIADYNDRKRKAERDMAAVDQKLKEAEILITERYERFKKLEEERNAAVKFQQLRKRLSILRASLAHKKFEELKDKIEKIDESIEKHQKHGETLDKRIEKIETGLDEKDSTIRDVADKLMDLSKKMEVEKQASDLRSKLMIAKDKLDSNLREIERLTALIDKMEAFEEKKIELRGGVPGPVKAILKLNLKGVLGTVSELIKVPEKLQVAIEVAAGRHLNDIVVDNEDVASYCIDYLKQERIGRATFLPLNKIKPRIFKETRLISRSGVLGVASKLIRYDTKYMRAIEFVLGDTLIVDNMEAAKAVGIGNARMATLEGDLIERSGAMIGGYYIRKHPKIIETSAEKEINSYRKLRKSLGHDVASLREEIAELEARLKKFGKVPESKEFTSLEKLRVVSEREIDELRDRKKRAYEQRVRFQERLNKLKIDRAKSEAEMENVKIDVEQYGEVEYLDESVPSLQKFIHDSTQELESIGPVNMRAIEEYEAFRTQFDGYKKKYEIILKEKKAIMDMIEEIEEKRREVFHKCLNEVSTHFNGVFEKMTSGRASLELENSLDLESGLIIQANPAGKRLLSIDAMSGGEKTLTALAFLFAIQKYKPAPFYILDEIDAALDKENTKKVAELIKKLSRSEQFIVITHNDQTIKYGDRVYGVTMERGESKILGLEMPIA